MRLNSAARVTDAEKRRAQAISPVSMKKNFLSVIMMCWCLVLRVFRGGIMPYGSRFHEKLYRNAYAKSSLFLFTIDEDGIQWEASRRRGCVPLRRDGCYA